MCGVFLYAWSYRASRDGRPKLESEVLSLSNCGSSSTIPARPSYLAHVQNSQKVGKWKLGCRGTNGGRWPFAAKERGLEKTCAHHPQEEPTC